MPLRQRYSKRAVVEDWNAELEGEDVPAPKQRRVHALLEQPTPLGSSSSSRGLPSGCS